MAYTSVIPVHRLDRSIEYVKDKEKPHRKQTLWRLPLICYEPDKDGTGGLQDTIGCTNENAYADMVATKRDSIRWAVWKDTIWYRVLQKVR